MSIIQRFTVLMGENGAGRVLQEVLQPGTVDEWDVVNEISVDLTEMARMVTGITSIIRSIQEERTAQQFLPMEPVKPPIDPLVVKIEGVVARLNHGIVTKAEKIAMKALGYSVTWFDTLNGYMVLYPADGNLRPRDGKPHAGYQYEYRAWVDARADYRLHYVIPHQIETMIKSALTGSGGTP